MAGLNKRRKKLEKELNDLEKRDVDFKVHQIFAHKKARQKYIGRIKKVFSGLKGGAVIPEEGKEEQAY